MILLPVSSYAYADLYDDCDYESKRLDESDLRKDPVFKVFLDKFSDVEFSFTVEEAGAPWFVSVAQSYVDDVRVAKLFTVVNGCFDYQTYELHVGSTDREFYLDSAFPDGAPTDEPLMSLSEITTEVRNIVFSEGRFGDNICDKQLWMNLRSELVCIKESSVNTLLERGYLIVDDLIKELNT